MRIASRWETISLGKNSMISAKLTPPTMYVFVVGLRSFSFGERNLCVGAVLLGLKGNKLRACLDLFRPCWNGWNGTRLSAFARSTPTWFVSDVCCCCCSHINSHNQVRGKRTGSSHSGAEEYPNWTSDPNSRSWHKQLSLRRDRAALV